MKPVLYLIALIFVLNFVSLSAAPAPAPSLKPVDDYASLSREDLHKLIEEELQLTIDILQSQNQILSMMLVLSRRNLDARNANLRQQIEELKNERVFQGTNNEQDVNYLQAQLDSTAADLARYNKELDKLRGNLREAGNKINQYNRNLIALAKQIVDRVAADKDTKLPPDILPTLQTNYEIMAKTPPESNVDQQAYANFRRGLDDYITYLRKNGKDTKQMEAMRDKMDSYNQAAQDHMKQYLQLQQQINDYQDMLNNELATNKDLQSRLQDLRNTVCGTTYEDKIYFESGSTELSKEAKDILNKFAQAAPKNADFDVLITGFCDDTPIGPKLKAKYASNWELSLARSSAVVGYLLNTLHFDPHHIIIAGKGEYSIVQSQSKKETKAASRRVEFRFQPRAFD